MKKNKFLFSLCGVTFLRDERKEQKEKIYLFFSQQRKQGHLKQSSKANQVDKRKGGKRFTLT